MNDQKEIYTMFYFQVSAKVHLEGWFILFYFTFNVFCLDTFSEQCLVQNIYYCGDYLHIVCQDVHLVVLFKKTGQ